MYGLKRNTIDKFYTNKDTVKLCGEVISHILDIDYEKDLIIEPSAGNGSFRDITISLSKSYQLLDIEPEADDIIQCDYLKYTPDKKYRKIHVIGNPPFGRQSSTAIKFIKHSASFCDTISFILPKSFKKESMRSKFPLQFHLTHQQDLEKKCFLLDGDEYDVPCIFQVWEKKDKPRPKKVNKIPKGFMFVKKNESHDISFRRVGGTAGTISTQTLDKNIHSHYFIRFTNKDDINKILCAQFETDNTVGPKSISKQELITEYNKLLI